MSVQQAPFSQRAVISSFVAVVMCSLPAMTCMILCVLRDFVALC